MLAASAGLLLVAGPVALPTAAQESLEGTFVITAGTCSDSGAPNGSYFRMVQPGGTADGPYVTNGDSECDSGEATVLAPGTDSGLITGTFQDLDAIVAAAPFFGTPFQVLTQTPDGQTGTEVPAPTIQYDGNGGISSTLSAWAVFYNGTDYNQGAPKPDGSTPGLTSAEATGTYDPETNAFTLDWISTISGGAFNNFSGVWHLEGTFQPAGGATPSPTPTPPPSPTPAPTVTPTADPTPDSTSNSTPDPTPDPTPTTAVDDSDLDDMPDTGPFILPALGLLGISAAVGLRRRR